MTTGDGIFWAALFYCVTLIIGHVIFVFNSRVPNKQVGRLDRIEKVLKDAGMEDWK